jgi:uncharacterized protein YjbJ (UPF0337 family)
MNEEQVKSGINTVKGKIKEDVGNLTGNKSLEGEGYV